jgi:hypothetical protein
MICSFPNGKFSGKSTTSEIQREYFRKSLGFLTQIPEIQGCQWEQAMIFFETMPSAMIEPDVISYSAAISACEKAGQWETWDEKEPMSFLLCHSYGHGY